MAEEPLCSDGCQQSADSACEDCAQMFAYNCLFSAFEEPKSGSTSSSHEELYCFSCFWKLFPAFVHRMFVQNRFYPGTENCCKLFVKTQLQEFITEIMIFKTLMGIEWEVGAYILDIDCECLNTYLNFTTLKGKRHYVQKRPKKLMTICDEICNSVQRICIRENKLIAHTRTHPHIVNFIDFAVEIYAKRTLRICPKLRMFAYRKTEKKRPRLENVEL